MARPRSPEKRAALLQAAAEEIASAGLGATTAQIARRAGVAEGTLFTYFESKQALFNELYLELKREVYACWQGTDAPTASLKERAWQVWSHNLAWSIANPAGRRASVLLNLSDLLTPETRKEAAAQGAFVMQTVAEIGAREALAGLPAGYAARLMGSMQDTAAEFIARKPSQQKKLTEESFRLFWRAVK